jgi:hypothetical protein
VSRKTLGLGVIGEGLVTLNPRHARIRIQRGLVERAA